MRVWMLLLVLAIAGASAAQDFGGPGDRPAKDPATRIYIPPEGLRQGGDTVSDATVISMLPFNDSGDTYGYVDDYDEVCPYTGSTSPDVVYSFSPEHSLTISVDLCGSDYDTKTYVYDADLNMIACDDDYYSDDICGLWVSKIESVDVLGGETYFIVVDGYGGDSGVYELNVYDVWHCFLECHPDAVAEGEPPMVDGYVDMYNGGCDSPGFGAPFQDINWTNDEDGFPPYDGTAWLCGTSGWYHDPTGVIRSDTDWFRVFALETGMMEFTLHPVFECTMRKWSPTVCEGAEIELEGHAHCFLEGALSFPVTAGEEIWLSVGPAYEAVWAQEFIYNMAVSNNTFEVVPTEAMTWGKVKTLYR